MANPDWENIYKEIYDIVYPKIKMEKEGLLYWAIHIIETDKSKADEICHSCDIKKNFDINQDLDISVKIYKFFIGQWVKLVSEPILNIIEKPLNIIEKPLSDLYKKFFVSSEEKKMEWIIIAACTLVGIGACLKFLKKKNLNNEADSATQGQRIGNSQKQQPIDFITAALCLVVPASAVRGLQEDSLIDAYIIERIIDSASYFVCTEVKDVSSKEQYLELDKIANREMVGENQEVYIRMDIPNAQGMIDQKVRRALKTNLNLPANRQVSVKKLACLKNLSGLENFNRV